MDVLLALHPRDPAVVQGGSAESYTQCCINLDKSNLLACEPVLHVDTHQAADEVLGLLGDVVPVGGVKLELA